VYERLQNSLFPVARKLVESLAKTVTFLSQSSCDFAFSPADVEEWCVAVEEVGSFILQMGWKF